MLSEFFRWTLVSLAVALAAVAQEEDESSRRLTPYRDELVKRDWLREVELDGYTYCFLDAGSHHPLVLLHGLGGSLYDWRHMVEGLADKYRVIAPDLLGAGESSKPPSGDYSVVAQARRVKGLLDLLDIDKVTLVGNSYGGGVALAFAQFWPERLESLVLINSVCYADEIPLYMELARFPGAPDVAKVLPVKELTGWLLRGCYQNEDLLKSEEIATYVKELASPERRAVIIRTLRALLPDDLTEFQARLRAIQSPALLLWGESDDVVPLEFGNRLAKDLANARLIKLEAGHVPNQELPQVVEKHIEEFLSAGRTVK